VDEAERLFDRMARYPDYSIHVAIRDDKIVGSFALLIMDNLVHQGAPSGVIEDARSIRNGRDKASARP